jgi:glycine cleavage system aminomethyltransferase T
VRAFREYTATADNSLRLRKVLAIWEAQNKEERKLRAKYAKWLVGLLLVQFAIGDAVLFLIGFDVMELPQWVSSTFFSATTAQIISMAFVVLRYLFPRDTAGKALEIIQKL